MFELLLLLLPGSALVAWALVPAVRSGPGAVGKQGLRSAAYHAAPKLTRTAYDLRASRGPAVYDRWVVRRQVRRMVRRTMRRSRLWRP